MTLSERVLTALKSGPLTTAEVIRAVQPESGIPPSMIHKRVSGVLTKLVKAGTVEKVGAGVITTEDGKRVASTWQVKA